MNTEERTLGATHIQIERKLFHFALKENQRGKFLRITEEVAGRQDHIIVPASGLQDFISALRQMAELNSKLSDDLSALP